MVKLTEKIVVERELSGPLSDMVKFFLYLENSGMAERNKLITNEDLIVAAHSYWDRQHGDDE